MPEERLLRIGREIFLAAFGMPLENVDSWVIDRMTSILDEQEVHEGQTLYTAGGPVGFIYFMQDGEVRFTRDGGPSWTAKGRWVLGGFEALGDRPATHTATALSDFGGMRVQAVDWVDMLEDSSQLARSAVVNASRTLMRMEARIPTGAPASAREASTLSSVRAGTLSLVERLALLLDVRTFRLSRSRSSWPRESSSSNGARSPSACSASSTETCLQRVLLRRCEGATAPEI
jgi:CRP-like cAMP-binding protein